MDAETWRDPTIPSIEDDQTFDLEEARTHFLFDPEKEERES